MALARGAALTDDFRIAVVGAGIAGLACASSLKARGARVVVYEAGRRPGGRNGRRRSVKSPRFAIVGVCAWLSLDDKGACAKASIGVTGACATATRARSTEAELQGKFLDDASIKSATAKAADGMDCLSDIHASAEYRTHLVSVFTEKAVKAAAARAR